MLRDDMDSVLRLELRERIEEWSFWKGCSVLFI
jgi:hypothetical protein